MRPTLAEARVVQLLAARNLSSPQRSNLTVQVNGSIATDRPAKLVQDRRVGGY